MKVYITEFKFKDDFYEGPNIIAESFEENCDSIFNAEFIPLELPLVK